MKVFCGLFTSFSHATMVREVMTSTAASSDLNHQKGQNSETLREHTGINRAISCALHHLKYNQIAILTSYSTIWKILCNEMCATMQFVFYLSQPQM